MMTEAWALIAGLVLGSLTTFILVRPKQVKIEMPGRHRREPNYSPATRGYWQ